MPKSAKEVGAEAAVGAPVCAVCGVEAPGMSRCAGCREVHYCSREHQKQHWKAGGHREACCGVCTRCLEPMTANGGNCLVGHPSHLLREGEKVEIKISNIMVVDTDMSRMDLTGNGGLMDQMTGQFGQLSS